MLKLTRFLLVSVASFFVISNVAYATPSFTEEAKIKNLLAIVEGADLIFIRNGSEYNAEKAKSHLLRKYKHTKKRLSTAEQFIIHVASKSSMSGKPYYVRLKDGTQVKAVEWLKGQLNATYVSNQS